MLFGQLKLNKILVGLALVMGMGISHTALANTWTTTSNNNCKTYNINPQPNETATWSGECKDGYVHGQGTLQWYENGKPTDTYVGSYSQGKQHGKGVYTWADGSKYDGEYKDGIRHGLGKLTLVRGNNGIASWQKSNWGEWRGDVYVVQGEFYENKLSWKLNDADYAFALASPKGADAVRERNQARYDEKVANFRKNLKVGDDATAGMVIEIKGNLIKIQTNDSQCSQRDYKGNCSNWINTPVEKWVKRSELYPLN